MGEPVFDRSKRYVDKKGKKFGKGVWLGYNRVISPGWGDFDRKKRTVTQYNTDGTKTVFSWKDWQDKKTKEHEYKVLQNDRKYAIPYIPEKKMTITIDNPKKGSKGITLSENVLDSIAVNAKKAGLPFSTALGIAAQESTIGSNSKRSVGRSMQPMLYSLNQNSDMEKAAQGISYQGFYSPSMLISNWKQIAENPFANFQYDPQGYLLQESKDSKYYDDEFNPALRKSNNYELEDTSPLYQGFKSYKENPKDYNPGDPDYPNKVEKQRQELVNHSPEVKNYMQKNNLHSEGGSLDKDYWSNLPMKDKSEMIRVAIKNGITTMPEIKQAYNEFAKGGRMKNWTMQDEAGYRHWRQNLPKNLRNTNDNDYDMRAAYKAGAQPMWNDEDKSYHLQSRDPETGRIFKAPHHPTYLKALLEDARLGYYPTMDKDGNTYTETWEGNRYDDGGNLFGGGGKRNSRQSSRPSNSDRAMNYLLSKGMSQTGASAIVGTLQAESNLDPTIHAKMKGDSGEGLAQWTGSRKNVFWKTLEAIEPGARKRYGSIDRVPFEKQLDVVLAERPDITNAIHNAKDVGTATDIMLRGYENGGGTYNTMATKAQMDRIYGKWNNGYNNQMKRRLGNASTLLGTKFDPSSYTLSQGFFDGINSQINIPQLEMPSEMTTDPALRFKAPTLDLTALNTPKQENPIEPVYNPHKERFEGIRNFNTVMGLLGQQSPFAMIGDSNNNNLGLLSYINQIYS